MKISVVMPFDHVHGGSEFLGPEALTEIATHVEKLGFEGCSVTDHPCPPGRWLDAGGHHAQDPFVILALIAAVTRRVRLQTGILVLPYRNPFIVARSVSTLDVFSRGRTVLGIGAGYLKGEYFALGADFDNRNDVTDEYLRALKAAWSGEEFSFKGTGYEARGTRILPRPVQDPHPPLLIGGNSKRAIRRAVEFGDAWSPFQASGQVVTTSRTVAMAGEDDLASAMDYMKTHLEKVGRETPLPIILDSMKPPTDTWNAEALLDQIGRLGEIGVTGATVHIPGRTRAEWCDNAARYASEIVARVSPPQPVA